LILAYVLSERAKKGTGAIAMALLAGCGIFLLYSAVPLTDIPSAFFALWALYFVYIGTNWKQYLLAGLMVAVAFMFRFPQGLMLVVIAILIVLQVFQSKGKLDKKLEIMVERGLLVLAGFFIIVLPYLFANVHFYGNAFLPFIEGTNSIKGYASLYDLGFWYYFKQVFQQDPLFILTLLPIALLWKKTYRNKTIVTLSIALLIFAAYFIYQPHKEIRYALAFLPYVAILSAVAIGYVLEWTNMPQLLFFGLFVIVGFMLAASTLVHVPYDPNAATFSAFDNYFDDMPGARIMSATPYTFANSDVLLTHNLYGDWDDAYYDYNTFRSTNDYIALDSCNLEIGCADDTACKDDKPLLLAVLNKNDTKVFSAVTPVSQCTLLIYKLSH
jgi:4-amino-4-deoxy-L-arabinose transferase-like glycosyltransferase